MGVADMALVSAVIPGEVDDVKYVFPCVISIENVLTCINIDSVKNKLPFLF